MCNINYGLNIPESTVYTSETDNRSYIKCKINYTEF